MKPIRTKHTPNCSHPYTATIKGDGLYGWGNTPHEARECLQRQLGRAFDEKPIRVGDNFKHGDVVLEVIGPKPGGKIELIDRAKMRFVDCQHRNVKSWERLA